MNMYIYLLQRPEEEVDWDEYAGMVIIAGSENKARFAAAKRAARTHYGELVDKIWFDADAVSCKNIGTALPDTRECVVLTDYHAG